MHRNLQEAQSLPTETASADCSWCGLPAGFSPDGSSPGDQIFCCYGCRLAAAVTQEKGTPGAIRWTVLRLGLAIFFTMNLMAFTMTMWSPDVYDVDGDRLQQSLYGVFRWLSLLLATPVVMLLAPPIVSGALQRGGHRMAATDLLITAAVAAAFGMSTWNVFRGAGPIYFEVSAMVLVMMTLGRWIEATGRHKATEAVEQLAALLPDSAVRLRSTNPNTSDDLESRSSHTSPEAAPQFPPDEEVVALEALQPGDLVRIRAGNRIPTDGLLLSPVASIDDQIYTGESVPQRRTAGDQLNGGTVNLEYDIRVQVTHGAKEGSFARLLKVLSEARQARGRYQLLADRLARGFLPLVLAVTVAAFVWHLSSGVMTAIQIAMSVLLIACPCALGLATPLAVWSALAQAARYQVVFRSGESVERLASAAGFAFDKTGTLSTGSPSVIQSQIFGHVDADWINSLVYKMADASDHPYSRSVQAYTRTNPAARHTIPLDKIISVPGGGLMGTLPDGRSIRLGSLAFTCCQLHSHPAGQSSPAHPKTTAAGESATNTGYPEFCAGCTGPVSLSVRMQIDRLRMAAEDQQAAMVFLSIDGIPAAGYLLTETLRPEAAETIASLHDAGYPLAVLTGDRDSRARRLLKELTTAAKTPSSPVALHSRLTPDEKVSLLRRLNDQTGPYAMVGDGLNDAPVLAAGHPGIAMGCGADVSRASADICLLNSKLNRIPWAVDLARRTRRIVRTNLAWAFGYNTLGIAAAACGWLNPALAAALMIGSSLFVIANSLRLINIPAPDDTADSPQSPSAPTNRPASAGPDPHDATEETSFQNQSQTSEKVLCNS